MPKRIRTSNQLHRLNTFAPNYSATVKSSILNFFLHYYIIFARSACKVIRRFMYTFTTICRSLAALDASKHRIFNSSPIFLTCRPAKYTALPIQHARTCMEETLPCFIFGARMSDLSSKYHKPQAPAVTFRDAHSHSFCNK